MLLMDAATKVLRLRFWLLILALLTLSVSSVTLAKTESTAIAIKKSPGDQRDYQYLVLPNQLRVLLISDPQADKAAASMDVGVGSYDDPAERQGLAHFLEHMLFLGTEKYPTADEYQRFIASKGGSHNAYTSAEHTNYFFNVDSSYLEESLDRFAQFFVAPLFTPEYVDRERHAVESEFRAKYKSDYRREMDVLRQLVRPSHPKSKFSVGNLSTLEDRDQQPIIEDLKAFYQNYYSSRNMALVVLGRETLAELEAMVVTRFSEVQLRKVKEKIAGEKLYDAESLPQLVEVQSLKDERRLTLSFAVPSTLGLYQKKPLQYIGHLLGHEGERSLLSVLKHLGFAEGLSAGGRAVGRNQDTFDVSILLTEKGYQEYKKVSAIVFKMIEKISAEGVDGWRFREQQKLSEMAFRFAEKGAAIHTVSRLANQIHYFPPEDIIRGAFALDIYDAALIQEFLSHLTPENLTLILSGPNIVGNQVTRLYGVPFRREALTVESVTLAKGDLNILGLPAKNRFIPGRLDVKKHEALSGDQSVPRLIKSSEHFDLWFKQDDKFQVPKAETRIRVYSRAVGHKKQNSALAYLYAALVNDALNEYSYSAYLAGLSYSMNANSRGFDIVLSGYSDRQGLLLNQILNVIDDNRFALSRFENIKSELVRKWRNQTKMTPYEQLLKKLPTLLYSPLWDQQDLADVLEASSFDDLKQFSTEIWQGSKIQMMVYGNFYRQDAIKFATLVENHLYEKPDMHTGSLVSAEVVDLGMGLQKYYLEVDHKDVAAVFYQQALSDKASDRSVLLMIEQMLRSSFFHQLRTEKQLGYIVFVSSMGLKDVAGNIFVVQSPSAELGVVVDEITAFLSRSAGVADNFEVHRQAVLSELTQAPQNLTEQSDLYWSEIVSGAVNFDRRLALVSAVESLTQDEFLDYSNTILLKPEAVLLVAGSHENLKNQTGSAIHLNTQQIEAEEFKAKAETFTYP